MILLYPVPQFPNVKAFRNLIITFYPDLESPESEKLTDSVSEKEEKDVDELDEDEKGRSFSQNQFHQTTGNNDMYALPIRRRQKMREELPPGWERHEVREDVVKIKFSEKFAFLGDSPNVCISDWIQTSDLNLKSS